MILKEKLEGIIILILKEKLEGIIILILEVIIILFMYHNYLGLYNKL